MRYRLMCKLNIHDRVQLTRFAIGRGVVPPAAGGKLGCWGKNGDGQTLVAPDVIADLVEEFGLRKSPRMRQTHRFPLSGCRAAVHLDEDRAIPIWIKDISISGIGFVAKRPCQIGSYLTIERGGSKADRHAWRCRVVRACRESDNQYRMGAVFKRIREQNAVVGRSLVHDET